MKRPALQNKQGPVVRSLVSANRGLRGIKTYRFPWYLTLVSANHALSNPGQVVVFRMTFRARKVLGTFEKRTPGLCLCTLWGPSSLFFCRWQRVRRCMYFSCFHQGQKTQILLPHFLWEQLTFYFRSRHRRKIISVREARISSRLYNFLVYYFFHPLPSIHFSSRYCHLSVLLFSESLSAWSAIAQLSDYAF